MDAFILLNMMKKLSFLFLIIFILLGFMLHIQTLEISSNSKIIYLFHAKNGQTFSHRWIHSVEKEEWDEFFVVKNGEIYLDYTRFKTFGAGVPSDVGKRSYLKDGWVYMVGINRYIGELHIRAGSTTNDHLVINKQTYTLSKANQEVPYFFHVENLNLFEYIFDYSTMKLGVNI